MNDLQLKIRLLGLLAALFLGNGLRAAVPAAQAVSSPAGAIEKRVFPKKAERLAGRLFKTAAKDETGEGAANMAVAFGSLTLLSALALAVAPVLMVVLFAVGSIGAMISGLRARKRAGGNRKVRRMGTFGVVVGGLGLMLFLLFLVAFAAFVTG